MNWGKTALLAGLLHAGGEVAAAANVESMLGVCRARAARSLKVPASAVTVKYEGQRSDKTHAVNGSADMKGQERTFQCSFVPRGAKIARFAVNPGHAEASRQLGQGKFNATGNVPCAQHAGQPMTQCKFGVSRSGNGTATVVVTRPDGRTRAIFFKEGKAVSADTSQADGYNVFRVTKQTDLFMITIGMERYEIPEAVVFGG